MVSTSVGSVATPLHIGAATAAATEEEAGEAGEAKRLLDTAGGRRRRGF